MVNHALLKADAYAKPIIAAVNGDCVGGGLELISTISRRGDRGALGLTEVKWSIYPFGGSTTKLVQQMGYVHAMDLLLTARLIDAEEAMRLGLVNRVVARNELIGWAMKTAERIAANSPSAVPAVKRQVTAMIADHVLAREAQEQELGDKVRAGPHFAEGVAAFREKRVRRGCAAQLEAMPCSVTMRSASARGVVTTPSARRATMRDRLRSRFVDCSAMIERPSSERLAARTKSICPPTMPICRPPNVSALAWPVKSTSSAPLTATNRRKLPSTTASCVSNVARSRIAGLRSAKR